MSTVLVTGGSGFIAAHCLLQLLAQGHAVRATVRSLEREPEVRAMLARQGVASDAPLQFFAADLSRDAGWAAAVAGCDHVLHVASPFPASVPQHEDELIVPAREGALRVLRAAREAGVKRVVLTSSFAAVGYGHPEQERTFDESDWTNIGAPGLPAYVKSKAIAERAAWDFIAREGGALELAVVNPVAVFGPAVSHDMATSMVLIQRLLSGLPGCPRLWFGTVDVRDVAALHLLAMTRAEAKGERFLAAAGPALSVRDIALALMEGMGEAARRVHPRVIPDWVVRAAALFNTQARALAPELGKIKHARNAKAASLLGWAPRSGKEAIVAAGESLLQLGLVKR